MQKYLSNFSSLYIHIPFCRRKCLFCSFTIAVAQEHRREEYAAALADEMQKYRGNALKTIYFGGGTPSMLDEKELRVLTQALKKNFVFEGAVEMTMEANPESITPSKASFLKSLGINRISLGIQSLNDRYLKFLGRAHDASVAKNAYAHLRHAGFTNINLDLMYGFPGQTSAELQEDVQAIGALGSEHLSLYSLTIEPNSRFFAAQVKLDDDQKQAREYVQVGRLLKEQGFNQYEISNFAKPSFESAHNTNYWLGLPYIGLGVGAHGFDGRRRTWNTANLQEYLKRVREGKETVEGFEDLSDDQLVMEKVLFGLRMDQGIVWDMVPADRQARIKEWIKDGFFTLQEQRLKTTPQGRLVLDELSARLV